MEESRFYIGHRIASIRTYHGLTQKELADMCNLHQSHIARIEAGKYNFKLETLEKIANALNCRVDFVEKR